MDSLFTFELGEYQKLVDAALQKATEDHIIERIWNHDYLVWADSNQEISNRLGWLDIADRMQKEVPGLRDFAERVKQDGIEHVLLLGMGGSSLAPEVFSRIFGNTEGFPSLSILDSTDPRAVKSKLDSHDPTKTLYIVATKSGGTIETISFFKTFYNQALVNLGEEEVGQHFIAITDPNSKLAEMGNILGFREIFLNDPNLGGRFSALSFFGLVPAALLGMDIETLLYRANDMARYCKVENGQENPGAKLGFSIALLSAEGMDKLTFFAPAELAPFGDWVEQLIAESTGKSGKGIVPVLGNDWADIPSFVGDRVLVEFTLGASDQTIKQLPNPYIQLRWEDKYDIGAQMFLWEFAIAVAGHSMVIHPFNQPNVESAKVRARDMMSTFQEQGQLSSLERDKASAQSIDMFISNAEPSSYISLQAYTQPTDDSLEALYSLKHVLEAKSQLPCTVGIGPRFLHSTGQLHKGDSGKGLFIQFLNPSKVDLPIPNEAGSHSSDISYEVLKTAQASGDAQALLDEQRKVLQLQVDGDFPQQIIRIAEKLK